MSKLQIYSKTLLYGHISTGQLDLSLQLDKFSLQLDIVSLQLITLIY